MARTLECQGTLETFPGGGVSWVGKGVSFGRQMEAKPQDKQVCAVKLWNHQGYGWEHTGAGKAPCRQGTPLDSCVCWSPAVSLAKRADSWPANHISFLVCVCRVLELLHVWCSKAHALC